MSCKESFPIFEHHPHLVYLDSAATSQKPEAVLNAMQKFYEHQNANVHRGIYQLSEEASFEYEDARKTVAIFLNAPQVENIVFTKNTTESINLVAYAWARKHLKAGDEILVSILEHHSNLIPWQETCKATGAKLVFLEINDQFEITEEEIEKRWNEKTKFVAITGMSNVTGTKPPLEYISKKCRENNIPFLIDAAQLAAHEKINVHTLDCDFLAFSGHKIYGPTGIGVLYVNERRWDEMDPFLTGGGMISHVSREISMWADMPQKFEAGTPPIAEAIGLKTSLKFIENIGWENIMKHEAELSQYLFEKLSQIENITLYSSNNLRLQTPDFRPLTSFTIENVHPHDIAHILSEHHICVRAGHHCCQPLMEVLQVPATARVSLGMYNTKEDIDKLIKALHAVQEKFS